LQHVEIPVATPKKAELLVKLEAASLNPVDWKMQKGMLRPLLPLKLPFFPGTYDMEFFTHFSRVS
jgi:NADPH:quinone reductase-like Zn-dependent oxidoreductase